VTQVVMDGAALQAVHWYVM